MKDKMETKKCYLIQEWLGDSYKICGVYDTVEDFIPEMKKYIERDGSLKIIRHKYVDKDKLNIYVQDSKNSKEKYTEEFLITYIKLNTIL